MIEALEDLKKTLLNDKFISKFYRACEKIVEILANSINRISIQLKEQK